LRNLLKVRSVNLLYLRSRNGINNILITLNFKLTKQYTCGFSALAVWSRPPLKLLKILRLLIPATSDLLFLLRQLYYLSFFCRKD
jgi:hypothetical protein